MREDSCGSSRPLRLDWITGQVTKENFWILHRSYCLRTYWIGCKILCVVRDNIFVSTGGKKQVEYISRFCENLTFRIFWDFPLEPENLLVVKLLEWSRDNKKETSSSTSVSPIFSVAIYAAVFHRKFSFLLSKFGTSYSFYSSCKLLASSSFSLLWVRELLCVTRYSWWGRKNNIWSSKDIYAVSPSLTRCRILLCI